MVNIDIPSYKNIKIKNVVFDYNGTLAVDGNPIEGIEERLIKLSEFFRVYILTADTFGTVMGKFKGLDTVEVKIISKENGSFDKLRFVKDLGAENTIAVGNGNNDALMLKESAIGICILGREGLACNALFNSDIVVKDIMDVFDMLLNHKKIIAALRK